MKNWKNKTDIGLLKRVVDNGDSAEVVELAKQRIAELQA
jgi:hypothetical protein